MINGEVKKTLWATADKLRSNMDAAEYKHIVLGLIFLKCVSDAFAERRAEFERRFADPADEYYIEEELLRVSDLEERDYYTEANVFWVPESARWDRIRDQAKQANLGKIIDDALTAIERNSRQTIRPHSPRTKQAGGTRGFDFKNRFRQWGT